MHAFNGIDAIIRGLVAAACLVIIAFGAYFGWMEYRKWQFTWRLEETFRADAAIRAGQAASQLKQNDISNMTDGCNKSVADLRVIQTATVINETQQNKLIVEVKDCISAGVIDYDAIKRFNLFK